MSRHRVPLLSALVCSTALLASPALAVIPAAVKSSSTPSHSVVQGFINSQLPSLDSNNIATRKTARTALISSITGGSVTPEYVTEYANDLAGGAPGLLKSPSISTRLNVAVVVAEVAASAYREEGSASGLAGVATALLKDKQPAVALWGIKAAKYVIASDIANSVNAAGMAKDVVDSVKAHADSGPIIEEAFNSLTLDDPTFNKLTNLPQFQQNAAKFIPAVLDLIAWRGAQYNGGGPVPSPLADRPVTVFLPVTAFGAVNSSPGILNRTLKDMGDTTCSTVHSVANGNTDGELLDMVHGYGNAFDTLGQQLSNTAIQGAGKAIEQVSANTDRDKLNKLCDDLAAALKTAGVNLANDNGPGADQAAPAPTVAGTK